MIKNEKPAKKLLIFLSRFCWVKKFLATLILSMAAIFPSMGAVAADNEVTIEEEVIEKASATYDAGATGFVADAQGNVFLFVNGVWANTYTGLYNDPNCGWWVVQNGIVNFNYNDLFHDPVVGWWKITGGTIDFGYTGWYNSPVFGNWFIFGGTIDFDLTVKNNVQKENQATTPAYLKMVSEHYSYYVGGDFRRMRSKWSTARPIGGYSYAFFDEGELCVMSYVHYAVGNVYDYEINVYYVTEGTYSHDPAELNL